MKRPAPLRLLWEQHRPTVLLTAGATLIALFFAARFVLHMAHWHDIRGTRPEIEAWMTVRYVATAWHVPPEDVRDALRAPDSPRRQSIEDIAHAQGRPVEALLADLATFLHNRPDPG